VRNSSSFIAWVYCSGLLITLALGLWVSRTLAARLRAYLEKIIPHEALRTGTWRTVRTAAVITALVGGMSTTYYGCNGGYSEIQKSRLALFEKMAEQISSGMNASVDFLLLLLVISLVLLAVRVRKTESAMKG
jgi:hypothetical protein